MTKRKSSSRTNSKARITKKSKLIRMLSTKSGADAAAISSKLGWQSHSTRAAIAGLRKAGFEVDATKPDRCKPTRYRITATPAADTYASVTETVDAG